MEFSVRDVIVSPSHGVGRIEAPLVHEGKDGWKIALESGQSLFIPLTTAKSAIRKPISASLGLHLLAILRDKSINAPIAKWEALCGEMNPEPVAKALRSLYNRSPDYSMSERRLIVVLEEVLIGEIALVCGLNRLELETELKGQRDLTVPMPRG